MGSKSGIDAVLDVALTNAGGLSPTIAAFHNADNQSLGSTAFGLNTGGVAQGVNAAGNLDRQRESGSDLQPTRGVFASSTQTAQEFLASCTTTVAAGAGSGSTPTVPVTVTLTMANTNGFVVGGTLNFEPVFSGGLPTRYESAYITAVVANTSVTVQFPAAGALFTHTQPYVVQTFLQNQQRDFSGEGPCLTGIGANIAVDIESNSGGPPLATGIASGWTLDTDRNLQGKNNAQMAITATTAGAGSLVFAGNPWTSGLIIGQQILLSVGAAGAAVEEVIVSKNNLPVTGAGPITVNLVNPVVNASSTFATFDVFGVGLPASATIIGTEDCSIWLNDPAASDPKRPFNALAGRGGVAQTGQGLSSALNLTAATVVKASPGRLVRINVIVAGAAGTANDCTTTGAAVAANEIAVIPAAVGPLLLDWPCAAGIVVAPGAGQTIAVSFV
ncbi:MAG TPA: hypothetical protein VKQ54_15050 [Caulobacteraceae bacterium]|nr:hypothetical protein [Caulobacteraceae bacterium]